MGIIGFSFSKFDCLRGNLGAASSSIEVKYNISIKDVKKTSLAVTGTANEALKLDFLFEVNYSNDIGKILIEGDVVYTDTPEIIKETFSMWEKEKKVSSMVHEAVSRFVFNKSVVKAIDLSDSLNLPSPVPMPKISFNNEKK